MDSVTLIILVVVAVIALLAGFAYGKLTGERAVTAERDRANGLQGQVDGLQGQVNLLTTQKQDLEQDKANVQSLKLLLEPMKEAVDKLQTNAVDTERRQSTANAALMQQIDAMKTQNADLQSTQLKIVGALTSSASRGRWGEMQLEKLFEYAGMVEGIHYFPQSTQDGDSSKGRPDFRVELPNSSTVFIDAKFPFDAYWQALSAETDAQREEALKSHARAVKDRVTGLSRKEYQNQSDSAANFVVLFLPFESLYYAALEVDPELLSNVFSKNVVIATPATMMGLLHTIKFGIAQNNAAENAEQIRKAGVELLDRFAKFAEFIDKVDSNLTRARKAMDELNSSYNSRLLPIARQMESLGVESKKKRKEIGSGVAALEVGDSDDILILEAADEDD